ncbi:unnamed protein product, partial [Mesorhabditis spiculigera]
MSAIDSMTMKARSPARPAALTAQVKDWSILRMSSGNSDNAEKDAKPAPKSSSAIRNSLVMQDVKSLGGMPTHDAEFG